jgi:predicted chitinase
LTEAWRRANLRYWPWYGRGYVQLTWKSNYERADRELELGGTLTAKPDRAMEKELAARIMRRGMDEGWFTGVTLSQVLPNTCGSEAQYESARRIINGSDCAHAVAQYALAFDAALSRGGW